jgi:hypothetical protein
MSLFGHFVMFYQLLKAPRQRMKFEKNTWELLVLKPIPVAAQSKALVFGCSLAGIACSNLAGGMDVCLS